MKEEIMIHKDTIEAVYNIWNPNEDTEEELIKKATRLIGDELRAEIIAAILYESFGLREDEEVSE